MPDFDLESAVQRYGGRLFRYVYTLLCDYHEAEDVTQDVFVAAYCAKARFNGEKLTVVAAGNSGGMAILYVTLQDTAGLGRITKDTQPDFKPASGVQGFGYESLYFDAETGIAAYQITIDSHRTFDGQSAPLEMLGFRYGAADIGEIRMDLDLAKMATEGSALTSGHVADIPGTKGAWISAIGINDGVLTVRFAQPAGIDYQDMNEIYPYLLDAAGNRIDAPNGEGGNQGAYDYMDYSFDIGTTALDSDTLCFGGSAWSVITGDWALNVELDSFQALREFTVDLSFGDVRITGAHLTLNPLGMRLWGTADSDVPGAMARNAILETTKGDVTLGFLGGGSNGSEGAFIFDFNWLASSAIDMNTVIAVRIGDNRIALP